LTKAWAFERGGGNEGRRGEISREKPRRRGSPHSKDDYGEKISRDKEGDVTGISHRVSKSVGREKSGKKTTRREGKVAIKEHERRLTKREENRDPKGAEGRGKADGVEERPRKNRKKQEVISLASCAHAGGTKRRTRV